MNLFRQNIHGFAIISLFCLSFISCQQKSQSASQSQEDSLLSSTSFVREVPAGKPDISYGARQNIRFFTKAHGLSHNQVRDIKEDAWGNIWLATAKGINKYNGQTFKQYLTQYEIYSIAFDAQGGLWVGTYLNGLFYFNGTSFVSYNDILGFKNQSIRVIFKDQQGGMWFGTVENGAFYYKNGKFKHIDLKQQGPSNGVMNIYQDTQGSIWIASFGAGMFKYSQNTLTQYQVSLAKEALTQNIGEVNSNKFHSIIQWPNGDLWFGSRFAGLYSLDQDQLFALNSPVLRDLKVNARDMFFDQRQRLWMSQPQGLTCIDGQRVFHITASDGIQGNIGNGKTLYDSGGNIWLATASGVNLITPGTFEYRSFSTSPNQEASVYGVVKDSSGFYWACVDKRMLYLDSNLQETSKEKMQKILPFAGRHYTSIVLQDKNTVWTTSFGGGITRINTQTKAHETFSFFGPDRKNQFFTSSCKDLKGTVWFGGLEGLVRFDGKAFQNFGKHNGLKNQEILCLSVDVENRLWIGSETGISIYDGTTFYEPDELQQVGVSSIIQGKKDHQMILGTRFMGLWLYNYQNKTIQKLTENEGLLSNSIQSLCFDHGANLWIGTDNGIQLWRNQKQEKISLRSFSETDGFIAKNCMSNAVLLDGRRMLWCTDKNITLSHLDKVLVEENTLPKISLQALKIYYKEPRWTQIQQEGMARFDSLDNWSRIPKQLSLSHNQNHITFSFIAVDWKYPDPIKYSYKLTGIDRTWSGFTVQNEVIYSALKPGKYTFEVMAMNKNNNQSKPLAYTFVIEPPFWQTYWFMGLSVMFLAGLLVFYVKNREKLLKERQKVLEIEVDKRTIELKNEKQTVEKQNKNIKESIEYAKRIQDTILPDDNLFQTSFSDSFIIFKPKDIVSGDFYFIRKIDTQIVLSVVDCTGHGVPGAFMSIIGHNLLEKIIVEQQVKDTHQILNQLNAQLIEYLKQENASSAIKDGMNLALCCIDLDQLTLNFSGSYNPLYLIRDQNIMIYKGDKIPIGKSQAHDNQLFTKEKIQLQKGDTLYLFSDGFADQKGGPEKKKMMYSRFRELLLNYHQLPMDTQKHKLENALLDWRRDLEQTDDVCVIGLRI